MTPASQKALSTTIRKLRERLLTDLRDGTESAYRLGLPVSESGLSETQAQRRIRFESWIDERFPSKSPESKPIARQRFRSQLEKQAAYTFLNRMIFLRLYEASGLARMEVLRGGYKSVAYKEFREWAPALLADETEGYATLLQLVFDELSQDLPGLFGNVGISALVPIPPATLQMVVEALNDSALDSCWDDDTTLGWVYQYWNDPEREALDAKLNRGGKVENHEIASKTQMFTERYMVEWMLHNTLGQQWLALSKKNRWTPLVESEGVLERLESRRADWRLARETGEVALDALMPTDSALELHWRYWVPQPLPKDAVEHAPSSLRELKLLDPACGSGHFLVIAFDMLMVLYREEAHHRGKEWSDESIAAWIL